LTEDQKSSYEKSCNEDKKRYSDAMVTYNATKKANEAK
jgi:hypothetical protein